MSKATGKRKPTLKQRQMVKEYMSNGGKKTAAIAKVTGLPMDKAGHRLDLMNNPVVENYMTKVLDKAGLTDEKMAVGLRKLFKRSASKASLKHSRPEHLLKTVRLSMELKDRFPADRKQVDVRGINVNLTGKNSQELSQSLDDVMDELQALKDKTHSDKKDE